MWVCTGLVGASQEAKANTCFVAKRNVIQSIHQSKPNGPAGFDHPTTSRMCMSKPDLTQCWFVADCRLTPCPGSTPLRGVFPVFCGPQNSERGRLAPRGGAIGLFRGFRCATTVRPRRLGRRRPPNRSGTPATDQRTPTRHRPCTQRVEVHMPALGGAVHPVVWWIDAYARASARGAGRGKRKKMSLSKLLVLGPPGASRAVGPLAFCDLERKHHAAVGLRVQGAQSHRSDRPEMCIGLFGLLEFGQEAAAPVPYLLRIRTKCGAESIDA